MPGEMCRHCGRKRGHAPGCTRGQAPRARQEKPPTVKLARDWFDRFGSLPECITPNGRRLFAFLLELAEQE